MKQIKVLGTGCRSCRATAEAIEARAKALGVEVEIEKVQDVEEIFRYGVMATPGVIVDGEVVHSGGAPKAREIDAWLGA